MPPMACCRAARWRASRARKLKSLVVTDSIAAPRDAQCTKIRRISIAPLIGEAIRRINNEESVSSLFD